MTARDGGAPATALEVEGPVGQATAAEEGLKTVAVEAVVDLVRAGAVSLGPAAAMVSEALVRRRCWVWVTAGAWEEGLACSIPLCGLYPGRVIDCRHLGVVAE